MLTVINNVYIIVIYVVITVIYCISEILSLDQAVSDDFVVSYEG